MSLYADRFWHAELADHDDSKLIRLVRSSERIDDLTAMQASLVALAGALRDARDSHELKGLLLDTRAAPPRNVEGFESLTSSYRRELEQAFTRVATLVGTQVGKLQLSRLDRQDGTESVVFEDEDEALAYLIGR